MPTGTVEHPPRGQPEAAVQLHGMNRPAGARREGIAPGPAAPQVFERVPLIEPVRRSTRLASSVDNCHRASPPCLAQGGAVPKGMYMGQLRLGEQAVQAPKLGGGQHTSAAGFSTDTPEDVENFSGCLQPARRSRGGGARRARR